MLWRGTAKGDFLVRSVYHLQKEMEEMIKSKCSTQSSSSDVWGKIKRMQVPNAEKNFLWKACHDILPTRNNLHQRKVIDDLTCHICKLEAETAFHILWQYPSTVDVWCEGVRKFEKKFF
jgi:hypothetical protein